MVVSPKYRHHRASIQGIVTLNGRDHYLGPYGTQTSKAEYDRLVTEWLARGRLPVANVAGDGSELLTANHVIHGFWEFAQVHYPRARQLQLASADLLDMVRRYISRMSLVRQGDGVSSAGCGDGEAIDVITAIAMFSVRPGICMSSSLTCSVRHQLRLNSNPVSVLVLVPNLSASIPSRWSMLT